MAKTSGGKNEIVRKRTKQKTKRSEKDNGIEERKIEIEKYLKKNNRKNSELLTIWLTNTTQAK